jgi:DNA-binding CsgD family transcriptional regulator
MNEQTAGLRARLSGGSGDQRDSDKDASRPSRLTVLAYLTCAGYLLFFATVDALLEEYAETSNQMLVRVVLVSVALLGGLAVLLHLLQRERSVAAAAECRVQEARQQIQEARFDAALLTVRELGLRGPQPSSDATPRLLLSAAVLGGRGDAALLTAREREVAVLIARGCTSKEIANRLVITERTADTHADRIRAKLALRSRSEIVAWVACVVADDHGD